MKKVKKLSKDFLPAFYRVRYRDDSAEAVVKGSKTGRPSHRLTFHQRNLRIVSASVTSKGKKGEKEIQVSRINHIASFEQVRIHTAEPVYSGNYEISLRFLLPAEKAAEAKRLAENWRVEEAPLREFFPSIDESDVKSKAEYDIK